MNGAFQFKIIMFLWINTWRKNQKLTTNNVQFVVPILKLGPPLLISASSLDLKPRTWHCTIRYNAWTNHSLSIIDVIVVVPLGPLYIRRWTQQMKQLDWLSIESWGLHFLLGPLPNTKEMRCPSTWQLDIWHQSIGCQLKHRKASNREWRPTHVLFHIRMNFEDRLLISLYKPSTTNMFLSGIGYRYGLQPITIFVDCWVCYQNLI
jgi:hypothetical protein